MKYILIGLVIALVLVWGIYSLAIGHAAPWKWDEYERGCLLFTQLFFVVLAFGMIIGVPKK